RAGGGDAPGLVQGGDPDRDVVVPSLCSQRPLVTVISAQPHARVVAVLAGPAQRFEEPGTGRAWVGVINRSAVTAPVRGAQHGQGRTTRVRWVFSRPSPVLGCGHQPRARPPFFHRRTHGLGKICVADGLCAKGAFVGLGGHAWYSPVWGPSGSKSGGGTK